MSWVEARLKPGATPSEVYHWCSERPLSYHHFWDEPWWPGAYVVRMLGAQSNLRECPAIQHLTLWDERPDVELYGEGWIEPVWDFFEAGSLLAEFRGRNEREKLVHCYLNAQGMSVADEARFALRFAWRRITLRPRVWWRKRRR